MCKRLTWSALIAIVIIVSITWWFLPDLKVIHPKIERYLKQELALQSLQLGKASWQWNGSWGLRFENTSLVTSDQSLDLQHSDITAYIALSAIIMGHTLPESIHLQNGSIHLKVAASTAPTNIILPPLQFILDKVDIHWQYAQQHGQLEQVTLDADLENRTLNISADGLNINAEWSESQDDKYVNFTFNHLHWLPDVWKKPLQGALSGQFSLQQQKKGAWVLKTTLNAPDSASFSFPEADFHFPFDKLSLHALITSDLTADNPIAFKQLSIQNMSWSFAKNQIDATGSWQHGMLTIDAISPYFDMPMMWSFLHPIDTGPWDQWLELMQHGAGHDSVGGIKLAWDKPWLKPPSAQNFSSMHYHMKGTTKDADIFLGMKDAITHTHADISLDEKGLEAIIHDTTLPHQIGHAQGRFYIAWDTLVLQVDAKSDAMDAGKMHTWLDPKEASLLQYDVMPASGDISLVWMPLESYPRSCTLNLQPTSPWKLKPMGMPLEISSGRVIWKLNEGVQLQNMQLTLAQLSGSASIHLKNNISKPWQLSSLHSELKGKWSHLINSTPIPIESPSGDVSTSLHYDNNTWRGHIDLSKAAWTNLLGSKKKLGEAFQINIANGEHNNPYSITPIRLQTSNALMQLDTTYSRDKNGVRLKLAQLRTPAFDGEINIWSPFKQEPSRMDIIAKYLNRTLLPKTLPHTTSTPTNSWILRSSIDLLEWGESSIEHADIHLTSAKNIHGKLKAKAVTVDALKLQDIDTSFTFIDRNNINLHHLSGSMDKQNFDISGTLHPSESGQSEWQGFAHLNGNLGDLMKQDHTSQLFQDGQMNLLFSGQGIFARDQPWWKGLTGRLRLNVKHGRIAEVGAFSKLLAAISLIDVPLYLLGQRSDLTASGLLYRDIQLEASLKGKDVNIRKLTLHSSAMNIAGKGNVDLDQELLDIILVVRPFQNMDAILSVIPIVRNILGGEDSSFVRKIYHLHGPIADASIDSVSAKESGQAASGLIESILALPEAIFNNEEKSP